ncbi:hypothetical protein HELRODRAFT_99722 [Helobdella robusta]|uniref:Peptidase M12B domain-containing protein n=1 Tax=Helobdella robusta TaxID=6412 RepID=T1G9U7_HELRO|nr:hypothetical protein HELRODRAFT_99722 [Helobdella robusta]ESO03886.1 hypothetical protein HELRODRAFT_99722 [Helobdella robusta]
MKSVQYKAVGNNAEKAADQTISTMSAASMYYQKLKIYITGVGMEIYTTQKIVLPVYTDGVEFTKTWSDYKVKNVMDNAPSHDTTMLVLNAHYGTVQGKTQFGATLGVAQLRSMCKWTSALWISLHTDPVTSASTYTHELGHVFGMRHTEEVPGCKCNPPPCIMDAKTSANKNSVYSWASCSIETLAEVYSEHVCLLKRKAAFELFPVLCGNGLPDVGEDCDCGSFPEDYCSRKCCDVKTCKFVVNGSTCATGLCCDLTKCQAMSAGTVCRKSINECDLEDRCDGVSFLCENRRKPNGQMCSNQEYCYKGKCNSRDLQCSEFWYPGTKSGNEKCYQFTYVKPDDCFHCDHHEPTKQNFPCEERNYRCGRLLCSVPGIQYKKPVKHPYSAYSDTCVCASYRFTRGSKHMSYVKDGVKCGTNQACFNRECIKRATLIELSDHETDYGAGNFQPTIELDDVIKISVILYHVMEISFRN